MSRASVWTISAISYAPHVSQTNHTNTAGQFYIVPIGWFPVEERATGIEVNTSKGILMNALVL